MSASTPNVSLGSSIHAAVSSIGGMHGGAHSSSTGTVAAASSALTSISNSSTHSSGTGGAAMHSNPLLAFDSRAASEQPSAIRVVIIPIGNISDHKFREYEALIRRYHTLDLLEIYPDISEKSMSRVHACAKRSATWALMAGQHALHRNRHTLSKPIEGRQCLFELCQSRREAIRMGGLPWSQEDLGCMSLITCTIAAAVVAAAARCSNVLQAPSIERAYNHHWCFR
jgi:hypothetical protein